MANLTTFKLGKASSSTQIIDASSIDDTLNSIDTRLKNINIDAESDISFLYDAVQKIIYKFGGEVPNPIHYDNEFLVILSDGSYKYLSNSLTEFTKDTLEENGITPSSVTDFRYSSSISSIDSDAFDEMTSLTSIVGPQVGSLSSIEDDTFIHCENLVYLKLNNGLTSIGDNCFLFGENLAKIILPSSLTSIGSSSFLGINAVKCQVRFYGTMDSNDFEKMNMLYSRFPGISLASASSFSNSSSLRSSKEKTRNTLLASSNDIKTDPGNSISELVVYVVGRHYSYLDRDIVITTASEHWHNTSFHKKYYETLKNGFRLSYRKDVLEEYMREFYEKVGETDKVFVSCFGAASTCYYAKIYPKGYSPYDEVSSSLVKLRFTFGDGAISVGSGPVFPTNNNEPDTNEALRIANDFGQKYGYYSIHYFNSGNYEGTRNMVEALSKKAIANVKKQISTLQEISPSPDKYGFTERTGKNSFSIYD